MATARTRSIQPCIGSVRLYFLPVRMRVPWKFGSQVVTEVTCARARVGLTDPATGKSAHGWGETPLLVQWVWPSNTVPYEKRQDALLHFTKLLAEAWSNFEHTGHALEIGHEFNEDELPVQLDNFNYETMKPGEHVPHLAALVCNAAFDQALHDAYGKLVGQPVYQTYNSQYLTRDLSAFLEPAPASNVSFQGKFPQDFLVNDPPKQVAAWHAVGGLDPLDDSHRAGNEPDDGYPVTLTEWIERDGLDCLKLKLSGEDEQKDYDRIVAVGNIANQYNVNHLTTDFNCTVKDPDYVIRILDRLKAEHPTTYNKLLYVEQPFPYDIEANPIDVHSLAKRKPLFMDESAHDWRLIRTGLSLGWNGVALKTCKTQTGAILSLCWARAHGMAIMVQDLTNPMLAQVPHILLAAHVGTLHGVETNSMQFYPDASLPEAKIHPGLYQRRNGTIDLSTLQGPGFGYRIDEIQRTLPEPAFDSDA